MTTDKLSTNVTGIERSVDFSRLEHRPCICGGSIYHFSCLADDLWICDLCCGAAGRSYEEAVREKIKVDFGKLAARTRNFLKQSHVSL